MPAPKRVHGYYVLPFLWATTLVARVDLKADRKARGACVAKARHFEPGASPAARKGLGAELAGLARWLGLDPP